MAGVEEMKAGLLEAARLLRTDGVLLGIIPGETKHDYSIRFAVAFAVKLETLAAKLPADASPSEPQDEQPTISVLFRRQELMLDGSLGAVFIGEFAGDRSKDLRLTVAQAQTLADQITQKVGNHTIFEQGAPPNAQQ
jgi:hypothetical protein